MSRAVRVGCLLHDGFPRVSGDEPYVDQVRAALDSFSPRERG